MKIGLKRVLALFIVLKITSLFPYCTKHFKITRTVLHGGAPVLHSGDVATELVLPLAVLYELSLHTETPHVV